MANGTLGEPLALRNAVLLYSSQATFGTPVTPATSAGLGLGSLQKRSNNARFRGPGSPNLVSRIGGPAQHDWSIRYDAVQTGVKALLQKAVRAAGVLPYITLAFGWEDDVSPTTNKESEQVQDAVVSQLELSLAAQGYLQATLSGIGGAAATLTNRVRTTLSSVPWAWWEGVVTDEGAAYPLIDFRLSVNHNVSADHVIPGSAPASFKRGFKYLTPHAEVISGSLTRFQKLGHNVLADAVAERDIVITLTSQDATVLTITLTDCDFANESQEHSPDGIRWSADFEARTWNLA
jgi:uncharacterized protein with HEPN domain